MIVKGVSKYNHPVQNPLLFATEPRTRDNIKMRARELSLMSNLNIILAAAVEGQEIVT
jgi:hypothetical protein